VVAAGPNDAASPWPVQLDLGRAWREFTGLPFVFAAWAAPAGADLGELPDLLAASKDAGVANRERIARDSGPILGWPVQLAQAYLTRHLAFDLTDQRRAGMERFFGLAREEGLA
jgi:chorismate dehydratase